MANVFLYRALNSKHTRTFYTSTQRRTSNPRETIYPTAWMLLFDWPNTKWLLTFIYIRVSPVMNRHALPDPYGRECCIVATIIATFRPLQRTSLNSLTLCTEWRCWVQEHLSDTIPVPITEVSDNHTVCVCLYSVWQIKVIPVTHSDNSAMMLMRFVCFVFSL